MPNSSRCTHLSWWESTAGFQSAWRAFEGAATSDPEAAKLYGVMVEQRRQAMQEAGTDIR